MLKRKVEEYDSKDFILLKGVKVHNLQDISVAIPKRKLTIVTGVSGSGKSSLAFDTLYAEGQRRYVESLSSYARQFMGKLEKPQVDFIKGIAPAVAVEQKVNTKNPRSTVGTATEIYDYIKLLFTRIGKTYSPISHNIVKRDTIDSISREIETLQDQDKIILTCIQPIKSKIKDQLDFLISQGYSRLFLNDEIIKISALSTEQIKLIEKHKSYELLIDRFVIDKEDPENISRILDSLQTAFYEGEGACIIHNITKKTRSDYNNKFELDGITFQEPTENFFSFNNPLGACRTCEGFGSVIGIDPELVFPNKNLSIYEEAIVCWKGEKMSKWKDMLVVNSHKFDFPIHKPIYELTADEYQLLWTGNEYFDGLDDFFKMVEENSYKIQYRVMLSRYRGKTKCHECKGTRLRNETTFVRVAKHNIQHIVTLSIDECLNLFKTIELDEHDAAVAKRLLIEITNRLSYLVNVGLGYLTLNRLSSTLSGGESQRINLATSLGSSLVGSMYILDEPSIGLHSKDTDRLLKVLIDLRDLGNTVIVVEHDEEIMHAADHLIDLGPEAGSFGGHVVFEGKLSELNQSESLTAKYLTHKMEIEIPKARRTGKYSIDVLGARENNLQNIDVQIPLNVITVITGVSGSGKSTLVKKTLYPALKKLFGGYGGESGEYRKLTGDLHKIEGVEFVDQNPIGRSSRSNPVTYIKAYDEIRSLYANQQYSKINGFKPSHFSFNVPGGRCDKCEGEGVINIEMQFMADIRLKCDECNGQKFKEDVLDVRFNGKNISELLNLTIDQAIDFFNSSKENAGNTEIRTIDKIISRLNPLQEVGLGYVQMGQSSSTLSGGEAQRVKLAFFLAKKDQKSDKKRILFIFDEPTTGLHFHDIKKLMKSFNALIEIGHSVLLIEHNLDIIKCADWVIDIGPEGGDNGGEIVFAGTPENLIKNDKSYTGRALQSKFESLLM